MSQTIPAKTDIPALTGLRGIAALWVLALHYTLGAGREGTGFLFDVAAHGAQGVVVFFALSGFILAYVYDRQFTGGISAKAYGAFIHARVARVYPLHLLTLLAWYFILYQSGILVRPQDNAGSFLMSLTLTQAWGPINYLSWNEASWTISVEAFCYLLAPVMIVLAPKRSAVFGLILAALCVWATYWAPYYKFLAAQGLNPHELFVYGTGLFHYTLMFVAGIAILPVSRRLATQRPIYSDLIAAAGFCFLLYTCTLASTDWWALFGSLLLILGLARNEGIGRVAFGNSLVVWLGEISFALYLTHIGVRTLVQYYYPETHWTMEVLAAFSVATALHYGFEKGARNFVRGIGKRRDAVLARA